MTVKIKRETSYGKKPTTTVTSIDVKNKAVATKKTGDALEVSQSTIKNWRRCKALYDYRFVQLLRRKRPIVQFIRGTMVGKCFDMLALSRTDPKTPKWQTALEPFKKQYGRMFEAEREYYGDPIAEVESIVTRYERIYANDGLKYSRGPDGAPFELPVRVYLAPGIVFTGHIDKMPIDREGRVWNMDHKSHKRIPEPEDRFVDLQQVFYMWAMPLSGYPKPAGVIWDYVRTKMPTVPEQLKSGELSQRQNMDTDYETYMGEIQRLKLNPKDYQKMLIPLRQRGHMDFFQRVPLPHPNERFIANLVDEARTTALEIRQRGGVDKTRTIDRTCKSCEFFSLCMAEFRGEDAAFIRKSEYETNPDPRHVHAVDDGD